MLDVQELYQELIIDHGRRPRNQGAIDDATYIQEGYNPLCGDKIMLYVQEKNALVTDMKFTGQGCAISIASTSLMTQALKGKTIKEAEALFDLFHQLMLNGPDANSDKLGKLLALSGVSQFPMRIKCATLAWHTFKAALLADKNPASTE